jgi:hypothetical protein
LPSSLARRPGMVMLRNCCKLKECGTAFRRRLAIQFSKTEPRPSIREAALESSLDRRGVAKTTVLRQGGRPFTRPTLCRQEKVSSRCSKRLLTRGNRLLHRLPVPVKPACRFSYRRSGARGAASNPSLGLPSSSATNRFAVLQESDSAALSAGRCF